MISLSDPIIRAVKLVETYERFIDLGAFDELLLVDRTRSAISNRSEHFLKVRLGVAQRLAFTARTLPQNLRFLIKETYRPLSLQRTYFERHFAKLRDELPSASKARLLELTSRYAAPPEVAAHSTGAAVDLTLATADGVELDMGSALNATDEESSGACYIDCEFISRSTRHNRRILASAMTGAGFTDFEPLLV